MRKFWLSKRNGCIIKKIPKFCDNFMNAWKNKWSIKMKRERVLEPVSPYFSLYLYNRNITGKDFGS